MGNLRHWRAKHLPEVTQGDRAEAGPKTMCVGSEVRLTPMWFLWGLISIVLGVGSVWGLISIVLGVGADEYRTPLLCLLGEGLPVLGSSRDSWVKPGSAVVPRWVARPASSVSLSVNGQL